MRFSYLKFDSNVSSGKLTKEMSEQRRNTQQAANHGSFGYHCTLCFVKEKSGVVVMFPFFSSNVTTNDGSF
jgi:hypothetical protein